MKNIVETLSSYLAQDRLHALIHGETLPDRAYGAALFADLSGFTSLTEQLTKIHGPRRGSEELSQYLNTIYDVLISEVENYGGSVVGFAGDAIIGWFTGNDCISQVLSCSFAIHAGMNSFNTLPLSDENVIEIAVKVSAACGFARRFIVGDPNIQLRDILAGETVDRMSEGEKIALKGETIVDLVIAKNMGEQYKIIEWRHGLKTNQRFAVLAPVSRRTSDNKIPTRQTPLTPEIPLSVTQLRPWLIKSIFTRLEAGQGEFLTELRPGVSVFVQFFGINFEEETAGAQLDQFTRRIQRILERYEGTLLDLTLGDKGSYLNANFGAITMHEDDARRAVQAALEIRQIPKDLAFLQPLQIGITMGTLRTGTYGGQTRRVYGVLGDDVNLAARLMEAARPGEILVSGRVQHVLGNDFENEMRLPVSVKGKTVPVPVFVIHRLRQERAVRLQEPGYSLPIIGRKNELLLIAEKLKQVLDRKGQIIGVVGEAGMGKSRLVAEAIHLAREKNLLALGGACQSGGVGTAYLVWRPIWQAFFEVDIELTSQEQIARLKNKLKQLAPQRMDALPLLGSILGISIPDNEFTQGLDPEFRKTALEAMVVDCLKGISIGRERQKQDGFLFVLEDLHWIDSLSRDLLEEIARACTYLPVLIILAYRPFSANYQHPFDLENLSTFTQVQLNELSPEDLENLIYSRVRFLFPGNGPPRKSPIFIRLVQQISERSQGNPFYAEELLNFLHDQNLNPYDSVVGDIELPNSLHQLILSRIDQLNDREKTTLKVASVIGRLFPVSWLHGYYPPLGTIEQIKADLEELRHLDLTPLDTPEPELAYLFKHIVTQEVTYESLSFEMRARLHEQLAQFLEHTTLPSDIPVLDLLAFHYGKSENQAKQREYFQKAGDAAQTTYANETALNYYERVFPLLQPEEQVEILLKQGAVHELTGNWEKAQKIYENALTLAEQFPDQKVATARCHQSLGVMCRWRGEYDQGMEWLEKARQAWMMLGDNEELSQTLTQIGIIYWRKGDFANARIQLEESLLLARFNNDVRGMAFAINNLGNVAWRQGDHEAAEKYHQESLILRRELGGKRGISVTLNNLGAIAHEKGEYDKAILLYEESLALSREMGDKQGISLSLDNLGMVAQEQGDLANARALFQDSLALAWELGDKPGILSCLSNLGTIAQEHGDFDEGRSLNEQALEIAQAMEDKFSTRLILLNLGQIAFQQGDYTSAEKMYQESLDLSIEMDDKRGMAHSFLGIAGIANHQKDNQRAGILLSAAETLKTDIQQVWETVQQRNFEAIQTEIKKSAGEKAFEMIWKKGSEMTLEEIIKIAKMRAPNP